MSLPTGSRLGPYEIVSAIGAGGMGEVYKARDTRLNRSVAVKVLLPDVAADTERRSRFEREAHAIAALSHPHICVVHDVGRDNGTEYLVMELLEGETLADRLARTGERGLPLPDVLRYATEIADALDKAHRAGITHRDLKPANIMLTKSGTKLLDFGLAKLARPAVPLSMTIGAAPTHAPRTASGTILGTMHYMSPEQVEGRESDARSDIWALGVVIYEMTTGVRPFEGESGASIIGAILKDTPRPLTLRQPLTPAALDAAVSGCLEKDPDDRWQSASDVRRLLRSAPAASASSAAPQRTAVSATSGTRLVVAGAVLTALVLAGVFAIAWRSRAPVAAPSVRVARFEVLPPVNVSLSPAPVASAAQLAVSPDERQIVFVAAAKHGLSQLWVRRVDDVVARPLGGTEGAFFPFWSPDSRYVAFFAGTKLKKVDVSGGSPQVVSDNVPSGRGGTWNADGVIVFAGAAYTPLWKVAAAGGPVTPVTSFDSADVVAHYWPEFLGDGKHFLYYQRSGNTEVEGIYVGALDSPTRTKLFAAHSRVVHANGFLFFVRDGALLAQPFDEGRMQTSGEAVRIGEGVGYFQSSYGYAAITAAGDTVAYGPAAAPKTQMEWRDRKGTAVEALATGFYTGPRLSPDGTSVVVSVRESGSENADIWQIDLAHRTRSQLTTDPLNDWFPMWARDGRRVLFGSTREGNTQIYEKTGIGQEERFLGATDLGAARYPLDMSPDGGTVLYVESSRNGYDIGFASQRDKRTTLYVNGRGNETQGRFSPNGRWVAYASDESGQFEIDVGAFPTPGTPRKISTRGGMQPEWRKDGKELFYVSTDGKLMAVPVTSDGATFDAGVPVPLFDVDTPEPIAPYPGHYAVSADGQRFLVDSIAEPDSRLGLSVILNWPSLVKK